MNLQEIAEYARLACGDMSNKKKFRLEAMKYLKVLVKKLQLPEGTYEVRWNEGGPAVSGEATLHADKIYVQISSVGCMYRTCKSRRDYSGGPNQWAFGFGHNLSQRALTNELVSMLNFA